MCFKWTSLLFFGKGKAYYIYNHHHTLVGSIEGMHDLDEKETERSYISRRGHSRILYIC